MTKQKLKRYFTPIVFVISILVLTTLLGKYSFAALIPPLFSDCVVAIGADAGNQPNFKITGQSLKDLKSEGVPELILKKLESLQNQEFIGEMQFLDALKTTIGHEQASKYQSVIFKHTRAHRWIASGFLYGHFIKKLNEKENQYSVYLVTNHHVLKGWQRIYVRFNPLANEPAREYELPLLNEKGIPTWFANPSPQIDVAVVPINYNIFKEQKMHVAYFHDDQHVANIKKMNTLGVSEGDFAYVLGFPMELIGELRNTVIVRGGPIARIRDVLAGASQTFLVDALIFPGNSGGPVVLKPEILSIEGTKAQGSAYLIGIVSAYVPYQEVAVSVQTQRPRVLFEENSGLAAAYPVDTIEEAIQVHLKGLPK